MKMRLFNKTNHVLQIKRDLSIAPKSSLIRDLEYNDHIKRLEKNGFIVVTRYPENSNESKSTSGNESVATTSTKSSRKTSKDVVIEENVNENTSSN